MACPTVQPSGRAYECDSPLSISLQRKRAPDHDNQSYTPQQPALVRSHHEGHYATPEAVHTFGSVSMERDNSSASSYWSGGSSQQTGHDNFPDLAQSQSQSLSHSQLLPAHVVRTSRGQSLMPPTIDRPGLKRRKTAPDPATAGVTDTPTPAPGSGSGSASRDDSPASFPTQLDSHIPVAHNGTGTPSQSGTDYNPRKGNGKDGQDVWPASVEDAFQDALRIVPKLGRKKVLVHGKPCGRNELVAEYIRRLTGHVRSRKQVSSHIQVLKNLRRNDQAFMDLVSEPVDGEESFEMESAVAFFGNEEEAELMMAGMMAGGKEDEIRVESPVERRQPIKRSQSAGTHSSAVKTKPKPPVVQSPTPVNRAALQSSVLLRLPDKAQTPSQPLSASTTSLEFALDHMHLPPLPSPSPVTFPCTIAPVGFCVWAEDSDDSSDQTHVFAKLDSSAGTGPVGTTRLEELSLAGLRYPEIQAMRDQLSCPFMHVQVNLDLPERTSNYFPTQLHTQLKLSAASEMALTAVTTIYSFGTKVISLEEDLAPAARISPLSRSSALASSINSSPASPMSPLTPGGAPATSALARHRYSYTCGFAPHFWEQFLMGNYSATQPEDEQHPPSLCKSGQERADVAMAVAGLSVVQEFVVRAENLPLADGREVSAGARLGEVVLVVTFDSQAREGWTAGRARLTYLDVKRQAGQQGPLAILSASTLDEDDDLFPPVPALDLSSARPYHPDHQLFPLVAGSAQGSYSHSHPRKPSLSIYVPPSSGFTGVSHAAHVGDSAGPRGLTTPWPQLAHTPTCPPPMAPPAVQVAQQDRLQQIWAATAQSEWDKHSPALMGHFPDELTGYSVGGGQEVRRGSLAMAEMTGRAMAEGVVEGGAGQAEQGDYGAAFEQRVGGGGAEEEGDVGGWEWETRGELGEGEVYFEQVGDEEALYRRHSDAMRGQGESEAQEGYRFGSGGRY